MKKTLVVITSAVALAVAAIPTSSPASAHPALLIPAIIAAGAAGLGVSAAAAANADRPVVQYSYGAGYPTGPVVSPACHPARERIGGVWQRVEICR